MESTEQRRVCVRGIIMKDGKLFCQELKNQDGLGRGFWCTPGGGLDMNESLSDGVKRELLEETGVDAQVGRLLFVQQYSNNDENEHGEKEALEFFFLIENASDFETIDENASHFDAEISRYGFVDPKSENVLPSFLRTIDLERYCAEQKPVYFYTALERTK